MSEYRCADDEECDEDQDEICCPETFMCGVKGVVNPEACGKEHLWFQGYIHIRRAT